jgi:hypothetical protein
MAIAVGGGDGALQIVSDREKLAREICNGILARILHRPLGAAPRVPSASARSMRSRKDAFSAASALASAHSSGAGPSFLLSGISISCNCLTALPGFRFGGLNWLHKTA